MNSVTIKLPPFWTEEPELWFVQAEAQFQLRSPPITTQKTRFWNVVGKIPAAVSREVKTLLQNPNWETAYDDLKEALIQRYTPSKWQKAEALINHPGIGDSRPTALWNSMMAQLPDGEPPGVIFQALFLARLPTDIRTHLVAQTYKSPKEMADHADRLWDSRHSSTVATVAAEMDHLETAGIFKVYNRRDSSPTRPHRSQTPGRPTPAPRGLCFYHGCFGSDAQKCESPCSFQGNFQTGGRRKN